MDRIKTWGWRLGCVAIAAGALLSRDACLGGSRPPPPQPAPSATATAAPAATAAPTGAGFATPP